MMSSRQKVLLGTCLAVMGALLFLIAYGANGLMDLSELKRERDLLVEKKEAVAEENERLARMIGRLRSDPEYIESMARHKLKMIGEDEVVFKFTKGGESKNEAGG